MASTPDGPDAGRGQEALIRLMAGALRQVAAAHAHVETAGMPGWLESVEEALALADGRGWGDEGPAAGPPA